MVTQRSFDHTLGAAVNRSTSVIVFEILLVLLGAGSGLVLAPTIEIVMAGSFLSTAYRSRIGVSLGQIPATVREAAAESIGGHHDYLSDQGGYMHGLREQLLEAATRVPLALAITGHA